MTARTPRPTPRHALLVVAALAAPAAAAASSSPDWTARLERLCAAPSREFAAKAEPIARWAALEHRLFKGHEVGVDGRIWRFGNTEAENEPLDDATRREIDTRDARSWQRVVTYWENGVGPGRSPAIAAQVALNAVNLPRLALDPGVGRASAELLQQVPQLVQQAAIANRPWSAAFVGHVMRQAELGTAFTYAEMHAVFIADAMSQTLADAGVPGDVPGAVPRAFRGCPPETTAPRPGDLLCFARDGATGPRGFTALMAAHRAAAPPPAYAAHCDVVTRVDAAARTVEVVGGNAWQSVTRRTMRLDARGRLAAALRIPEDEPVEREARCRADPGCANLNRRRYIAVLRLR